MMTRTTIIMPTKHTHSLLAIFPDEPGIAGWLLDSLFPFIQNKTKETKQQQ